MMAASTDKAFESLDQFVEDWSQNLKKSLADLVDPIKSDDLFDKFSPLLSISYRDQTTPQRAAQDICALDGLEDSEEVSVELIASDQNDVFLLKVLSASHELFLSDILPVIENIGYKVHDEHSFRLILRESRYFVCNFEVSVDAGLNTCEGALQADISRTIQSVIKGSLENDCFNKLIVGAGLRHFDVVWVRAFSKYLKQINIPFSEDYMLRALVDHSSVTQSLIALFHELFDPDLRGNEDKISEIQQDILQKLDAVENADQDRILRHFKNLIDALLRTNFFQSGDLEVVAPYLCFKFDSAQIDAMPAPAPWREIWVYSPRVEGVHLRGGPVARGGLRWSDRPQDFRTEVLGLVKAQQVKNTVIVPVGSKGGFVAKRLDTLSPDLRQQEGIECYKLFIQALLDITDNRVEGVIQSPKRVKAMDEADPYLVVAADKGTATFSDIANEISLSQGFWLGDAFASGGSAGYDHKKMGITARGAWESVKRHFSEMGKNIQKEDFSVIGIGDMGGDVFGNGMLLSHHIRLIAAFNHKHIFLDPNPDAQSSWQERKRLFDNALGWDQYDPDLLSKGGAVFDRSAKTITLSAEIQKAFNIETQQISPHMLIRHLLTFEAELLWFGGIGTYVKSVSQNNLDVGDKTNDALRVNGADLRCKVIGEGANLGLTQLGRIEYALKGGRLNTDSIDNAAGVDCSDHEVNLKILLAGAVVKSGKLSPKKRDRLLSKMTQEVARLVLQNNYNQTQALSLYEFPGTSVLDDQLRLLKVFDNAKLLARDLEALPSDKQIIAKGQRNEALSRPEIAIMMSYSKIWLLAEVLKCDFMQTGCLDADYLNYFPANLRENYPDEILAHPLKNEILATVLTNELVNRIGGNFVARVMERSGQNAQRVIQAFFVCRDIFNLKGIWKAIEDLDQKTEFTSQMSLFAILNRSIEPCVLWLLKEGRLARDHKVVVAQYQPLINGVRQKLADQLDQAERTLLGADLLSLSTRGVPDALLMEIALVGLNTAALDVAKIVEELDAEEEKACETYLQAGRQYYLNILRQHIQTLKPTSKWQKLSIAALMDDVSSIQAALTRQGLSSLDSTKVREVGEPRKSRFAHLINEINRTETPDYFLLSLACRQLGAIV